MTIWVLRNGAMVIKGSDRDIVSTSARSDFPTPRLSHMEAYASPIDGQTISSWRQRDADLASNDCYDPRDLPKNHVYTKSQGRKKVGADG